MPIDIKCAFLPWWREEMREHYTENAQRAGVGYDWVNDRMAEVDRLIHIEQVRRKLLNLNAAGRPYDPDDHDD